MAKIYQTFSADDIVEGNPTEVTTGLWSGDSGSLAAFELWSDELAATNNANKYYLNVYDKNPQTDSTAEVQFAVAYGHISGSGAPTLNQQDTSLRAPLAVYLQYKNLLLTPDDTLFTFDSYQSEHIYVLNIQRTRLKGKLDPGNFQITLTGQSGSFTFIDDSLQTLGSRRSFSKSGRVFNLVSGSLTGTSGSVIAATGSSWGGFGLVYPDMGVIVMNPDAITKTCAFLDRDASTPGTYTNLATGSVSEWNSTLQAMYTLVWGDNSYMPWAPFTASLAGDSGTYYDQYNHLGLVRALKLGGDFQARSAETVSSTHYFVRLRNKDFNYTNNPTFATGSTGKLSNEDFIKDPRVFATAIGLYNDQNELLAVAKLSRALEKSFDKEALVRVRLDF